jgi:hypothetical protein
VRPRARGGDKCPLPSLTSGFSAILCHILKPCMFFCMVSSNLICFLSRLSLNVCKRVWRCDRRCASEQLIVKRRLETNKEVQTMVQLRVDLVLYMSHIIKPCRFFCMVSSNLICFLSRISLNACKRVWRCDRRCASEQLIVKRRLETNKEVQTMVQLRVVMRLPI